MDVDGGCRKMCFLFFFFSPLSSSESMYLLSETCLNVSFTYYFEISQTKIIFADIFSGKFCASIALVIPTQSFWGKYICIPNIPSVCPTLDFLYLIMVLGKLNELAGIGVCVIYLLLAISKRRKTHKPIFYHIFINFDINKRQARIKSTSVVGYSLFGGTTGPFYRT